VKTVDVSEADRKRFCLSDEDVIELARFALKIESTTSTPWISSGRRTGLTGKYTSCRPRPETVKSRKSAEGQERFLLKQKSEVLASGRASATRSGRETVRVLKDASEMGASSRRHHRDRHDRPQLGAGDEARRGHRHNRGGRTCHAAIIARELGIPAVVGCGDATTTLEDGEACTVSCAEGDTGNIYRGISRSKLSSREYGKCRNAPSRSP